MNRSPHRRASVSGFMLLEVLVSILIFSFGVLAIVGMITFAVKQSADAKYRADAALLANDLIGRMWVDDRSFAGLSANYDTGGTPGATYNAWLARVQTVLPGSAANAPTVAVVSVAAGASAAQPSSEVTVTLRWKPPNEPATDPVHNLSVITRIR